MLNVLIDKNLRIVSTSLMALALSALLPFSALGAGQAKIVDMSGEVRFKNPSDADWQKADANSVLSEGAHVFVGPDSDCQIVFGDDFKSVTRIKSDAHVILTSFSSQPRLEIVSGEILALVRNLKKEMPFEVTTPSAVATVRGTAFSFSAEGVGGNGDSRLQVYEHTVGLAPLGKPDLETPIGEGFGAVMGADGMIQKQFDLSPNDMQTGHDFIERAADMMALEGPAPVEKPALNSDTDTEEPKKEGDDQKTAGPTPPGPPSGDGSGPSGNDTGRMPHSLSDRAGVDSAVDGVVMNMAQDSELSRGGPMDMATMQHMATNLADLSYQRTAPDAESQGPGVPPPGPMNTTFMGQAMQSMMSDSPYFQNQTPEVQQQMMSTGIQPPPPGGTVYPNSPSSYNNFNTMVSNPTFTSPISGPTGGFIDPNTLASTLNNLAPPPPPMPINQFFFIQRITADYQMYVANHGGSDVGYFATPRFIPNFTFIQNDIGQLGSIQFTPDPAGVSGNTFQVSSVNILSSPTAPTGTVVFSPTTSSTPSLPVPTT